MAKIYGYLSPFLLSSFASHFWKGKRECHWATWLGCTSNNLISHPEGLSLTEIRTRWLQSIIRLFSEPDCQLLQLISSSNMQKVWITVKWESKWHRGPALACLCSSHGCTVNSDYCHSTANSGASKAACFEGGSMFTGMFRESYANGLCLEVVVWDACATTNCSALKDCSIFM